MRVTYNSVSRNVKNTIVNRYEDLSKQQEILSTGKRLMRPSDNPIDVANDIKLKTKLARLNQQSRNISDGLGYMEVTDTAMMSMDSILQRARELAISGSSDTLSANERKFIAEEVEQLIRQTISLGNTEFKGDYVFAGTQTKIEPFPVKNSPVGTVADYTDLKMATFDASGGPGTVQIRDSFNNRAITDIIPGSFSLSVAGTTYAEGVDYSLDYVSGNITIINPALAINVSDPANYQFGQVAMKFEYIGRGEDIYGNPVNGEGEIMREIEDGVSAPINITTDELMRDPVTGANLMSSLIKFGQSLLQNDQANITASVTNIDLSFKIVLAAQSKNGARINRFETTQDRNESQIVETTRRHSELEDADVAEEVTKFKVMEMVYNAALQSSAKIIQPSLVNFL